MRFTKETITGRKNPVVMLAASLSEKKYREAHRLFLAEGRKLCEEAIAARAPVRYVLLSEKYARENLESVMESFADPIYSETELLVLGEGCFDKITTEKAPEGIILVVKYLDISERCIKIDVDNFEKIGRALFLVSIRDPGNLGTVLRGAGAFGAETVILSEDCADVYNPRTVRAAMGAVFRVPTLRVADSADAIKALKDSGRRVFAAELREHASPISHIGVKREDIFVIGNEGHGIPPTLSASCTGSVYLPIENAAESLNAAMAATIFLWEQSKVR